MHDLASNTELDSENHKMKVALTPKFRHLSPKRNNIEPRKQTIKNSELATILQWHLDINTENFSLVG